MGRKPNLRLLTNADFFDEEHQGRAATPRKSGRKQKASQRSVRSAQNANDSGQPSGKKGMKVAQPKSPGQQALVAALSAYEMTIAVGPAGCGKTYLAINEAVRKLSAGEVKKVMLVRPAVEAGEKLGFLPGGPADKIDPYMKPLFDALLDTVSPSQLKTWLSSGVVELAPIAFMRGRTLKEAAIIVDEAQNATFSQLKMIATRLGEGSSMVFTGDPEQQSDLPSGTSGLNEFLERLEGKTSKVGVVRLKGEDIVRHALIREILPLLSD